MKKLYPSLVRDTIMLGLGREDVRGRDVSNVIHPFGVLPRVVLPWSH